MFKVDLGVEDGDALCPGQLHQRPGLRHGVHHAETCTWTVEAAACCRIRLREINNDDGTFAAESKIAIEDTLIVVGIVVRTSNVC